MGGTLTVTSTEGQGTVFTLTLPVCVPRNMASQLALEEPGLALPGEEVTAAADSPSSQSRSSSLWLSSAHATATDATAPNSPAPPVISVTVKTTLGSPRASRPWSVLSHTVTTSHGSAETASLGSSGCSGPSSSSSSSTSGTNSGMVAPHPKLAPPVQAQPAPAAAALRAVRRAREVATHATFCWPKTTTSISASHDVCSRDSGTQ